MIAMLRGRVRQVDAGGLVIDVGGVGYQVLAPAGTLARLPAAGEEVELCVHTRVRDDSITLYGFLDPLERDMFVLLNSVSGVGPKLALAALSALSAAELAEALLGRDIARLTSVSGVGKKTAQRLCMELRDRVGELAGPRAGQGGASLPGAPALEGGVAADAVSALVNLGYGEDLARRAVEEGMAGAGDDPALEEIIRRALRRLA